MRVQGHRGQLGRGFLGLILFALLMGLWAYLWVPSLPVL